jgi:radical SAM protein with 4Fe4S-binding SPASM domain
MTMINRAIQSLVFEITQKCNHNCLHCYNAWKNTKPYPAGELGTADTIAMLDKIIRETSVRSIAISGGEPFLRKDLPEIVEFLRSRAVAVNIITNGTLIDEAAVAKFKGKISVWELPLLSVERDIHDRMSGRPGAFDKVTMAIAELKAAGERIVTVFVATKLNLPTWEETAELAFALGADGIMFNRFNPGGEGFKNLEVLQATPAEVQAALDAAENFSEKYKITIACSIAMPPCLFDTAKYKKLSFGFCAAGTERAYYALDPVGNIRPCNHSNLILGNIRERNFWDMADSADMRAFKSARPIFCAGCKIESECLGGCKAAAEVCYGSPSAPDPFLKSFMRDAKPVNKK